MFQEDLGAFFEDFGILVTLQFADGTTRGITAIFDNTSLNADLGSYSLDTSQPMLTARSSDVADVRWREDAVLVEGKTYDIVLSPQHDGTGLARLTIGLSEHL